MITKRKRNNYINNKDFHKALSEFHEKLAISIQEGKQKPPISNYIGQSILQICNNLARKPNFYGYTYKEEMVEDGILDCIAAVEKYNPNKTQNPFAYFTQIAWNAFIRRIYKEKKETYTKHKNFQNQHMQGIYYDDEYAATDMVDSLIEDFEKKLTKKKKAPKIKGVELFADNEEKPNEE